MLAAPPAPPAPSIVSASVCRPAPGGVAVTRSGGVSLWVRTVGRGRPVLYIPSLGRGVADFDDLARRMAAAGYMAILPDPRGTGRSTGPAPSALEDLANDVGAVIADRCDGAVDLVGHAFGNRVARMTATLAPERVGRVALLAGGGEVQPTPEVRQAIRDSTSEGLASDSVRLKALSIAFFARGADPSVWLKGWWPKAAAAQNAASVATPVARWWTAGRAPLLLVQATEDPVAPPGNAAALRRDVGERVTVVELPNASHAMLPEQPAAVAAVLSAYFGARGDAARLQTLVSAAAVSPR